MREEVQRLAVPVWKSSEAAAGLVKLAHHSCRKWDASRKGIP